MGAGGGEMGVFPGSRIDFQFCEKCVQFIHGSVVGEGGGETVKLLPADGGVKRQVPGGGPVLHECRSRSLLQIRGNGLVDPGQRGMDETASD